MDQSYFETLLANYYSTSLSLHILIRFMADRSDISYRKKKNVIFLYYSILWDPTEEYAGRTISMRLAFATATATAPRRRCPILCSVLQGCSPPSPRSRPSYTTVVHFDGKPSYPSTILNCQYPSDTIQSSYTPNPSLYFSHRTDYVPLSYDLIWIVFLKEFDDNLLCINKLST